MKNTLLITSLISSVLFANVPFTNKNAKAPNPSNFLRIYNWEDYIYEPESEGDEPSIIDQFKAYYKEKTGIDVTVEYITFATNEEMYNKLELSKLQYDLLCPSDYMIQRLIREDKLEKFTYDSATKTYTNISNYNDFASPYLRDIFEENNWSEYSVGYMWGTMGFIYNTEVTDVEDLNTWNVLWNDKYQHKVSIKDSMRETYLTGLFRVHHDALLELKAQYEAGTLTAKEYNNKITDLLNDTSDETIKKVEKELNVLKTNIYGFEVDSGKHDIVTGKIAINTAWSGDAVYSIGEAPDKLRYAVPSEGTNVWFDGWVMPKGANVALAEEFINFISNPSVAIQNVDYIGYTSFIAGEDMMDYIEAHDEYNADGANEVDLTYFFGDTIADPTRAKIKTDVLGGQLTTQFPSEEEITRAAVMRDFGAKNEDVVAMWTRIRSTPMSPILIVIAVVVPVALIIIIIFMIVSKKKSSRNRRKVKKS